MLQATDGSRGPIAQENLERKLCVTSPTGPITDQVMYLMHSFNSLTVKVSMSEIFFFQN